MIERENRKIGEWTAGWLAEQGIPHAYLPSCDSTSRIAKDGIKADPPWIVYLTDFQENGRGRGKNTWTSPEDGSALLATWSIELSAAPKHLTAPKIGLALYQAVTTAWPEFNWSIKPPNDLYLGSAKVAGLLIETLSSGKDHRLLVGLGMNVFAHPPAVPESTSIEGPFGRDGLKLSQSEWNSFLESWHLYLQNVLVNLAEGELDPGQMSQLLAALKAHPVLGAQTVAVETTGNIVYQDHTKRWQDL